MVHATRLQFPDTEHSMASLFPSVSIQVLMITLLLEALEALRVQSASEQVGVFTQRMRYHIDAAVVRGDDIGTASVARAIGLSYAYAKVIFRKHVGQPIGGYIRTCKLAPARRMLEAGDTPAQDALCNSDNAVI